MCRKSIHFFHFLTQLTSVLFILRESTLRSPNPPRLNQSSSIQSSCSREPWGATSHHWSPAGKMITKNKNCMMLDKIQIAIWQKQMGMQQFPISVQHLKLHKEWWVEALLVLHLVRCDLLWTWNSKFRILHFLGCDLQKKEFFVPLVLPVLLS